MIHDNPQKLAGAVTRVCNHILRDARMVTPRDPARPPKDLSRPVSGDLRANSDIVKVDSKGLTQRVEYYQEYAIHQELGAPAINLPARPFLTPAVEQNAEAFIDELTQILSGDNWTGQSWLGGMGE